MITIRITPGMYSELTKLAHRRRISAHKLGVQTVSDAVSGEYNPLRRITRTKYFHLDLPVSVEHNLKLMAKSYKTTPSKIAHDMLYDVINGGKRCIEK
jgi:hypothetical protein